MPIDEALGPAAARAVGLGVVERLPSDGRSASLSVWCWRESRFLMAYADQEMSTGKLVSIGVVALLHIGAGYALVTGLAYDAVKQAYEDLKTFDVQEEKPAGRGKAASTTGEARYSAASEGYCTSAGRDLACGDAEYASDHAIGAACASASASAASGTARCRERRRKEGARFRMKIIRHRRSATKKPARRSPASRSVRMER
jgi:hypothetical protein